MKLYILFGQRHENYEGELAPEALAVVDEFTHEENSDYIYQREEFYKGVGEFVATEVVMVETGTDGFNEIKNRLSGKLPPIIGKVV